MTALSDQDRWLGDLGLKMVDVWFYIDGQFRSEPHVDDPGTLHYILERRVLVYRCRAAFYAYQGRWALYRPHHSDPLKRLTYYDTLAAVEMKVIHG